MTKALIVYGTRMGATSGTSEEIAKILRQEGIDTRVVDAKQERIKDISEYGLVVVGSGIQIGKWYSEPEDFLKNFQQELTGKKVALFVSCGAGCPAENEGKPDVIVNARRDFLEEKAAKYNLQPIDLGLFGGIQDFGKMSWFMKRMPPIQAARRNLETYYKEKKDYYDTRDMDAIRDWARTLAQKTNV